MILNVYDMLHDMHVLQYSLYYRILYKGMKFASAIYLSAIHPFQMKQMSLEKDIKALVFKAMHFLEI